MDDSEGNRNSEWWEEPVVNDEYLSAPKDSRFLGVNRPRERVTWYDAIAFCRWLTARVNVDLLPASIRHPNDWQITLPTEWQWEKSARGHGGRDYPWGNGYRQGFANVDETVKKDGSHYLEQTSPVGIYSEGESPYHLLDMIGNVWEWCLNEYECPDQIREGDEARRVLRGGSWTFNAAGASARVRRSRLPHACYDNFGFRVVLILFRSY